MEMKKTKVVATIADNRCDVEFIKALYGAGMNVVRINSAHLTPEAASVIVNNVRQVSDKIAIMIDTKGPEIRTTQCENGGFDVVQGENILIKGGLEKSTDEVLYVSYLDIVGAIDIGTDILIDDGEIKLVVVDKHSDAIVARVDNSGRIKGRKSVNIPNVPLDLQSVTERDKQFIDWAINEDIDFIAHSFVRRKDDVLAVQELLDARGSDIKIISKIENLEGVNNINEILRHTYGVMIARGDLGVEIPAERIPYIQRDIIRRCYEAKRPVIVATQMLQSMINNPRPTRAEVSDIASAIFQRTDAIMLSGETANGAYPLEAVEVMSRVALEIEGGMEPTSGLKLSGYYKQITAQLAMSAVRCCEVLPIKAVIIDTLSGRTGRYLSSFRCPKPVFAICYSKKVMRELALSYGIISSYQESSYVHRYFLLSELRNRLSSGDLSTKDMIIVVGGDYGSENGPSFMDISIIEELIKKLELSHQAIKNM